MNARCIHQCAYCREPITSGQRWVREKVYELASDGRDLSYYRYHAESFARHEVSCWEKHLMETDGTIRSDESCAPRFSSACAA